MRKQARYLGLLVIVVFVGCAAYPTYTPPAPTVYKPEDNVRTVNSSFEEVWSSLIEYATSTFFTITNFEKDSGLITLQFGSGNPGDFVNCGYIKDDTVNYEGPLVDFFERYGLADLEGSMSILVKPITPSTTQVRVNSGYIFRANDGGHQTQVWSFNTGGSNTKTIGAITAICRPTHKAENTILDGVEQIVRIQPKSPPPVIRRFVPQPIPQEQTTFSDPNQPQTPPNVDCGTGKILVRNPSKGKWECVQDCGTGRVLMLDANNEWVCK